MTIEIALALLAGCIPLTALVLRFSSMVTPVQFVKLETEFKLFREEIRKDVDKILGKLEDSNNE